MNFMYKKIEILFEDEYICVINKPEGLLSVPGQNKDKSALSILEELMRKKGTWSQNHRPFAVHRLDRDTSGVMMFALSETVQKKLMDEWHTIVTERLYRALAENPKNPKDFLPDSGLIDDDLAFNAYNIGFVPKNQKKGGESQPDEKKIKTVPARTNFTVIARGKTHTLFELSLDTGKKNQIRAHLSSKGYPLEGDRNFRAKSDSFGRLCLHARTLEFTHPVTNKKMKFEIPEDKEWEEFARTNTQGRKNADYTRNQHETQKEKKSSQPPRHISAKEKAHMNFIELGKLKSRR
ncbi:MAG: RluA family pseudouridine synthase [Treponema sp.]|nr:RluA family pseudouridine synthase [Treponema sp.]